MIYVVFALLLVTISTHSMEKSEKKLERSVSRKFPININSVSKSNSFPSPRSFNRAREDHPDGEKRRHSEKRPRKLKTAALQKTISATLSQSPKSHHHDHPLIDKNGNTSLISAVKNNDISSVIAQLRNEDHAFDLIDINQKNRWGCTALHCASLSKNNKIIMVLLNDPRTDASVQNSDRRTARELYRVEADNEEDATTKLHLFVRAMIDMTVHEEAFACLTTNTKTAEETQKAFRQRIIEQTMIAVKERITQNYIDQEQKGRQQLPKLSDSYFPDYCDDTFITNMIKLKIDGKAS